MHRYWDRYAILGLDTFIGIMTVLNWVTESRQQNAIQVMGWAVLGFIIKDVKEPLHWIVWVEKERKA